MKKVENLGEPMITSMNKTEQEVYAEWSSMTPEERNDRLHKTGGVCSMSSTKVQVGGANGASKKDTQPDNVVETPQPEEGSCNTIQDWIEHEKKEMQEAFWIGGQMKIK